MDEAGPMAPPGALGSSRRRAAAAERDTALPVKFFPFSDLIERTFQLRWGARVAVYDAHCVL